MRDAGRERRGSSGLESLGRFAEPSVCILLALTAGPKHGYAIMSDARATSGVKLGPGTLYATLARLEERGLIEPLEPDDRRRPYRLTDAGAAVLEGHLAGMEVIVRAGRARLGQSGGGPPTLP
jgi:DNA-binding PadR family transcriptional regulator